MNRGIFFPLFDYFEGQFPAPAKSLALFFGMFYFAFCLAEGIFKNFRSNGVLGKRGIGRCSSRNFSKSLSFIILIKNISYGYKIVYCKKIPALCVIAYMLYIPVKLYIAPYLFARFSIYSRLGTVISGMEYSLPREVYFPHPVI